MCTGLSRSTDGQENCEWAISATTIEATVRAFQVKSLCGVYKIIQEGENVNDLTTVQDIPVPQCKANTRVLDLIFLLGWFGVTVVR